jgi:hypothetical protein
MRQDAEAPARGVLVRAAMIEQHEGAKRASPRRQRPIDREAAAEIPVPGFQDEFDHRGPFVLDELSRPAPCA